MKRVLLAPGVFACLLATPALAQFGELRLDGSTVHSPSQHSLPDLDARLGEEYLPTAEVRAAAGAERGGERALTREAAAERLRQRVYGVTWDADPVLGTPRFVRSAFRFLTAPRAAGVDQVEVVRAFLADYQPLFEIAVEELDLARRARDYQTRHNGVRHLTFQQQIGGVDLYGCELRANVTSDGALVNLSSTMLARPEGDFRPAAAQLRPLDAIRAAAASVGIELSVEPLPLGTPQGAEQRLEWSRTPDFRADTPVTTRFAYFPRTRREIVPAWKVVVPEIGVGNTYEIYVDATNGEILRRWNQLQYLAGGTQDVTFRVYTDDSPAPASPGPDTPTGAQFPTVPRQLLTITGASIAPYSPQGWIPDGQNETLGNNVDAHLDLNADNSPDLPRPAGSPSRVFDFTLDTTMEPTTYRNAATAQLFYLCNNYHDRLYALGFDEAAGNFQQDNFGMGGAGNDRVQADAQDGSGVNNANFGTPSDGSSGRMQMYVFNQPTPDRDGDLDANIVYHEYSHGLSNRLVGVDTLFGTQSGGMGEGWGDFFGTCLVAQPGDDPNGTYHTGGWTTYLLGGLTDNYYFGIRRFPYSTDLNKNPQTYADIDSAQQSYPPAIPRSPIIGNTATEVHNVGEVWCNVLMECRANLWALHGFAGNELIMQLVVDGMKLSPANPNFLEARDGILQADLLANGGANLAALWAAFAKRGMGVSATSPAGGSSSSGIHEAYDTPVLIQFAYPVGIPDQLLPGSLAQFQVDVSGIGSDMPIPGTGTIHWRVNGGGFFSAPMTETSANHYVADLPGGVCFDEVEFYVSVQSTAGVVTDPQSAPTAVREALVYTTQTLAVDEDFEVNNGWVATNLGATTGDWQRGVPVNDASWAYDPASDSDGSGQCWLTQNTTGNTDVDGGSVRLTTAAFDLSSGRYSLEYDYFLTLTVVDGVDRLLVEMSTNGDAGPWTQVALHTTDTALGWRSQQVDLSAFSLSSNVKFRFTANDTGTASIVEAGLDAFRIRRFECDSDVVPFCPGDGTLANCPCGNNGSADHGCDNAGGTGGVLLSASGDPLLNNVVLSGAGFPTASTPAVVVIRSTAEFGVPATFGDGLRCVSNTNFTRLAATNASGGLSMHPLNHSAGSGEFFYQLWYRSNPAAFCDPVAGYNSSSGLRITWP